MASPCLNEDVVISILSKLPVKSLVRLKCICKSWNSLIESPLFITTHLNRKVHHKDYLGLFMSERSTSRTHISFISYNTMKFSSNLILPFKYPSIIGSCNGLLCVVDNKFTYYVTNPATREFKILKEQDEPSADASYGFGFDPMTNDYKLVRSTVAETEVLTLKNNSWRSILMSDDDYSTSVMKEVRLVEFWSKAVLSNTLHWIGESSVQKGKFSIIAFDLIHERFRDINIPGAGDKDFHYQCYSSMFQDCLSISIICGRTGIDRRVEVWVMKEYGVERSWTKQYCINPNSNVLKLNQMFEYIGVTIDVNEPLWSTDDLLLVLIAVSNREKESMVENFTLLLQFCSFVFNCRESLVPID
ncbi:F-box domain containing protein [Trema orientale]|uniref:F-box domain containing protein n=1 Tax=Trema orientale TaxID=63057 RepID=A0A2P5EHI9_TREOI|nr:F-box domain containing protein [Trema orientale]